MRNLQERLGAVIASLRKDAGMTQESLVDAAGSLDQSTLSRIEHGKQDVSTDTLSAIARALNVKISDIWALAESFLGATQTQKSAVAPRPKTAKVSSDDISALRWVNTALVGYLLSREPAEVGSLITALEAMPEGYQRTGLGGTILSELDAARAYVAAVPAKDRPSQRPRKTAPSSRYSRP